MSEVWTVYFITALCQVIMAYLRFKKKISEVKVWTSKAAKPGNEIEKYKSKKASEFY